MSSPQELIHLIEEAFQEVHRGQGMTLQAGDVVDDLGTGEEMREAQASPRDQPWQDITDFVLTEYIDGFAYLDIEGFCYYLPALMRYSIRHPSDDGFWIRERVIVSLECGSQVDRARRLTQQQKHAVYEFLEHVAQPDRNGECDWYAQEAIRRYWGQFRRE